MICSLWFAVTSLLTFIASFLSPAAPFSDDIHTQNESQR
jgi:hypothetical protein